MIQLQLPMPDTAMKYFCFRFDVDTHKCIQTGIPNLIRLSKNLDVSFTFFMNMGRGTSRWNFIKRKLAAGNSPATPSAQKLSNLNKLGVWDYLVTALANPKVGASRPDIIQELDANGHEVGLHGGANHGIWQSEGAGWSEEKFRQEVIPAQNALTRWLREKPAGFSSPGWQGSTALYRVLESGGFQYAADAYGEKLEQVTPAQGAPNLLQVPTNILGEPGGIGYLEHMRARGMDHEAILKDFSARLENRSIAVVYDHPYYAGVRELPLVEAMVRM
ncbi:MAG: polysaccharide deacetylase family protein, partial [Nitrospinae bacterium]|nr:polysaccharide deacetylase family protein [Nitrospinota bacterium]